jgi:hypothetical protein
MLDDRRWRFISPQHGFNGGESSPFEITSKSAAKRPLLIPFMQIKK